MDEYAGKNNLARMIQMVDEFFDARNDPSQLSVDDEVIQDLKNLHPDTLTEKATADGPVAWMLIIPTTKELMERFITKQINERELYEMTLTQKNFDVIYLCSAFVLPEYRRQGLAKDLAIKAVNSIRRNYRIEALFYWAFSEEGKRLAESISEELSLPLHKR